jgi:prophage regulatory protein
MQVLPPLSRATNPDHTVRLERILSEGDVTKACGLSCSTIRRKIVDGSFPAPIPLSANRVGWLASEIAAWQRQQIAARDNAVPTAKNPLNPPAEQEEARTSGKLARAKVAKGNDHVSRSEAPFKGREDVR